MINQVLTNGLHHQKMPNFYQDFYFICSFHKRQTQCTFLSSHKKGLQSSKMGLKQTHSTQGEINLNKQKTSANWSQNVAHMNHEQPTFTKHAIAQTWE
jgi:hypothetical protein